MSDLSIIPLEDGFETQLAQDWNGAVGTVYVLDTPSYTPTTTNTYIVVNPGKTNMQIAEITDYDSTANTLTVSNVTLLKGLGINSTAPASSHATGSQVIISDNYQFWADIQTAINSKLDDTGGTMTGLLQFSGTTHAGIKLLSLTTVQRDALSASNGMLIYNSTTGELNQYIGGAWSAVAAGSTQPTASTTVLGKIKTDVAPAGDPVALITDNPKYDALAGTSGTPSSSNKYVTNDDTASTSSASKVVRANGSGKIETTFMPDGTILSVSAGENITAANPVYINPSDSLLYAAHGFKELDSTSISTSSNTSNKVSKLSSTQMMYLTHSGATLTITVYDINSAASVATQTVTTTFDTTGASVTLTGASVCRLSDTTFIVFYTTTASSALYFRTGSISGATITMDTATAYTGAPTFVFGIDTCPGDSDGKVVLSYMDGSVDPGTTNAAYTCVTSYLTCSTNTATVSYTTSFSSAAGGAYNHEPVWCVAQFTQGMAYGLGCIKNGDGVRFMKFNYIDTVGGNTGSGIDVLNLENETGAGVASTYSQYRPYVVGHNGNIYYGWAVYGSTDSIQNVKTVLSSSPAGTKIVYQSTTTRLAGDTSSFALPMFGNEMGVIVARFNTSLTGSTQSSCIYIQKDKVYPFYNVTTLGITNEPEPASWYSNSSDEIIICRANSYIKQWKLPTLFDGFSNSTVLSGNSTQIAPFITTSGLTASARYYLKDTYTSVGELNTFGCIPLGNAISSTVLKSDKY